MVQVNLRYVNQDDFNSARKIDKPYVASPADIQIQKDKSHYRVANFTTDPFQDGSTSYFHKSIGGYHAAKMARYQDLIEFQFAKQNMQTFNMMNVKYFIIPGKDGKVEAQQNPEANRNAWFVNDVKYVTSADDEIKALDSLQTKTQAVFDASKLKGVANFNIVQDSTATIKLTGYSLNHLIYESSSRERQFAVFSEIYYGKGWNAYINGELTPHYRVNYVLRGMPIPKGDHTIEFKFEPKVIETGSTVSLISYTLLLLIPLGWFFY